MQIKFVSWISIIVYTVTFFLASFTIWVPPAEARKCYLYFICFESSNFGSRGGSKRGPCATEEVESLVALAPENKAKSVINSEEKVGKTIKSYPTFWFYLPRYQSPNQSAKFILLDKDRHIIQDPIYVKLPQLSKGVIAGLTLPRKEQALEVGENYSWYFSIQCDPQKPSRNPEVNGQIRRVLQSSRATDKKRPYVVHDETYTGQDEDIKSTVIYDTVNQLVENRNLYFDDWKILRKESGVPNSAEFAEIVKLQVIDKPMEECAPSNNFVM